MFSRVNPNSSFISLYRCQGYSSEALRIAPAA